MGHSDDARRAKERWEATNTMDTIRLLRTLDDAKEDVASYESTLRKMFKRFVAAAATIAGGFATASTAGGPVFVVGLAAGAGGIAAVIATIILTCIRLGDEPSITTLRRRLRDARHDYDDALTRKATEQTT